MTKINKVGKSTFVIAILSFLLVAVLAFGGTYAYFSANTETATGKMTVGSLYVYLLEGTNELKGDNVLGDIGIVQPNQEILKKTYKVDIKKTQNSTINAFVRVKVEAALTGVAYTDNTKEDGDITPQTIFTITAGGKWYQHTDGYAYYVQNVDDTDTDGTKCTVAELTPSASSADLPISIVLNKNVGKGGSTYFMGKTGTFSISVEAIQADYLDVSDKETGDDTTYTVKAIADKWRTVVDKTVAGA